MRRALLSVSDKTGLTAFARGLLDRGYELVSTGGTARALSGAGLAVTPVSEVTGFPEMMDGRVKTLHPMIHGAILARRGRPEDLEAARRHGIGLIDLVAVNLYPFERAASDPATPFDALVEEIDIGGPSLVRASAKNFGDVLVVVSPGDYTAVLDELDRPDGPRLQFRFDLARKAFAHTAHYDAVVAGALALVRVEAGGFARGAEPEPLMPERLEIGLTKVRDLRYGENPHQAGAYYRPSGSPDELRIVQGKELSYTNLIDLDAAARAVNEFDGPAAVVVKHTNPCGAATSDSLARAYVKARDADALSAFGGIVGLNRPIDEETARSVVSTFVEAVIAPAMDDGAAVILSAKKNMRVVLADFPRLLGVPGATDFRSVFAGALVQQRDRVAEAGAPWTEVPGAAPSGWELRVVTARPPTSLEWQALRFAWRVCAHVKSNAVIFTGPDCTLAIGAGQTSRVDAVKVAVMRALDQAARVNLARSNPLQGSVVASDAFFPFRDGLDEVAAAGATAVVQPGGSMRDAEVIAAADEHGLAMIFVGRRHFRH